MLNLIHPGHGGTDPGAVSGGLKEKDLNLAFARLLAAATYYLSPDDSAILTRNSDVSMSPRLRKPLVSSTIHDVYTVIHHNAGGGNGFSLWVPRTRHVRWDAIAQTVKDVILPVLDRQGIRFYGIHQANFYDHWFTMKPSLFVEVGFIDSEVDRLWLRDYYVIAEIALSLAVGIANASKY